MSSILNYVKILVLALALSLGVSLVYAWTGPTATPPNGNTDAPINVSVSEQTKQGKLTINENIVATLSGIFGGYVFAGGYGGTYGTGTTCTSASDGAMRYNSTGKVVEYCNGTIWQSFGGGGMNITSQNVVTSSRAYGTVYQNTNSGPLYIFISSSCVFNYSLAAYTDTNASPSTLVGYGGTSGGNYAAVWSSLFFIVLPNSYYKVISNGSGCANPTAWVEWVGSPSSGGSGGSGGGLQSMEVFSTPGNFFWTKPDGITKIKITVVGGGGASTSGVTGAGGGGGACVTLMDVSSISTLAYTVGAGGHVTNPNGDGSGAPSGRGGTSSAGGCSATGGWGSGNGGGGAGGTGSAGPGSLNITGGAGTSRGVDGAQAGGSSILGGGNSDSDGVGGAYGGGASGGSNGIGGGADGGVGVVIIEGYN
ncbi:MAG: hypothetical protein Q7S75_02765 [bacterium]|nr:hypothetical protein [bacterium]